MKTIKQVIAVFSVSLLVALSTFPVLAAGGGGTGTGGGTANNADIALTLSSSSVKNGDVNVLLNPTIDLHFNKNVVNISVKSNNSKCFHLVDANGTSVSIRVIFPDDQLRSDYREHIFITPDGNLAPNSKYSLHIDKTLQAKNATSMNSAFALAFTTGQTATNVTDPSLKDLGGDVEVFTNKLPLTAGPVINSNSPVSSKASSQPVSNSNLSIIIISILAAAVVLFIILFLVRKMIKNDHSNKPRQP